MFGVPEVLLFAGVAGVLAAAVLSVWTWGHRHRRFLLAAATAVGFAAWNLVLIVTDARGFDIDAPVIPFQPPGPRQRGRRLRHDPSRCSAC